MFIPLPVLIVSAVALVLLGMLFARSRRRDPLMGGQQARRPMPALHTKPAAVRTTLPPEIEADVRALLAAGRKIDAIKLARDATGLGLRDTKDLVESFE